MTLRTFRYFVCPNGHQGVEKTSENDQPYSTNWETVTPTEMCNAPSNGQVVTEYVCSKCDQPMAQISKP